MFHCSAWFKKHWKKKWKKKWKNGSFCNFSVTNASLQRISWRSKYTYLYLERHDGFPFENRFRVLCFLQFYTGLLEDLISRLRFNSARSPHSRNQIPIRYKHKSDNHVMIRASHLHVVTQLYPSFYDPKLFKIPQQFWKVMFIGLNVSIIKRLFKHHIYKHREPQIWRTKWLYFHRTLFHSIQNYFIDFSSK